MVIDEALVGCPTLFTSMVAVEDAKDEELATLSPAVKSNAMMRDLCSMPPSPNVI
jgi:hypothetical protein